MMGLRWAMRLPEAWRLLRISLRPQRMLGIAVLSVGVCALLTAFLFAYASVEKSGTMYPMSAEFMKILTWMLFGYQALLWCVGIPMMVSGALLQEFNAGTWVFQQTAPQTARALLLGKLLGAGGDIYVASAMSLPALIAVAMASGLTGGVLAGLLYLVLLAALISLVFLYAFSMVEKQQANSSVGLVVVIPLIFLFQAIAFVGQSDYKGTFLSLNPVVVMSTLLTGKDAIATTIDFYVWSYILAPFAFVFYGAMAVMLFVATEGQLRRKMSVPMSRRPLFLIFGFVCFLAVGFVWDVRGLPEGARLCAYTLIAMGMMYFLLYTHARGPNELRPWLYRRVAGEMRVPDYLRDDAPAVYAVAGLAVVAALGHAALMLAPGRKVEPWMYMGYVAAPMAIIVVRDALYFQAMRLLFRKSTAFGLLLYALLFVAPTGLIFMMSDAKAYVDLTPATPLMIGAFLDKPEKFSVLVPTYFALNGIIAVLLIFVNKRLMARVRKGNTAAGPAKFEMAKQ